MDSWIDIILERIGGGRKHRPFLFLHCWVYMIISIILWRYQRDYFWKCLKDLVWVFILSLHLCIFFIWIVFHTCCFIALYSSTQYFSLSDWLYRQNISNSTTTTTTSTATAEFCLLNSITISFLFTSLGFHMLHPFSCHFPSSR